jgi:hypothetical protein
MTFSIITLSIMPLGLTKNATLSIMSLRIITLNYILSVFYTEYYS